VIDVRDDCDVPQIFSFGGHKGMQGGFRRAIILVCRHSTSNEFTDSLPPVIPAFTGTTPLNVIPAKAGTQKGYLG
jgi:hypothetical protein